MFGGEAILLLLKRHLSMNWDAERDMAQDVEENLELYKALADGGEGDGDDDE